MSSSMITGERRWASARRGGMTVLGKVAVPKPINLPSQRLENHGLDPNVEIVPKGTLSWGNRPSSAGSNPWGTSTLSPSTDGTSSSSSYLAGRPSSGGGSRPSTAGSERANDSNVNVWSSNSRPSSASGVLASNTSSLTSLRPRSAETRPGSSQKSRFAEPSVENSGAWGPNGTSERIGAANSRNDGFSLSSGDFPTLGSEKDESVKNAEPLDHTSHGRPGSSPGMASTDKITILRGDDVSRNSDCQASSWRRDGIPYAEDGPRPGMERWHGEPHPYQNPNMAPPHYESWRGAPPANHPPGGVWYRGPPGPPPYGAPPGSFPMEPFPYYRPQVPAPGLTSSQPIPPAGAGPHGHHPKNGDMYRPHMPDTYMRPGMPMRPGFYPGPVPYEGYYGPPMGFCNPNERDLPYMGMAAGPPVYNRPVNLNSDPNNSLPGSGGEARGPDHVEPGHPHDPRGNYKVLKKHNDNWNQSDEEKWGHRVTKGVPNHEKGILSRASTRENTWEGDFKKDEEMHYGKSGPGEQVVSQSYEKKSDSTNSAHSKFPGSVSNVDVSETSSASENVSSPRDQSLIQKIESLNVKARASGGKQHGLHREDRRERVQNVDAKANRCANDANPDVVLERHYPSGVLVPVPRDMNKAAIDRSHESAVSSVTAASRRSTHGVQSRGDHQGKERFNGPETDGWRKKSESVAVVSAAGSKSTSIDQVEERHVVVHISEVPKPYVEVTGESVFDPSDTQRSKMREIAKQRALQRQREEEERTREQKAKALAKLEELNRRSADQCTENPCQKEESVPSRSDGPQKQEDSINPEQVKRSSGPSSAPSNNISQIKEKRAGNTMDSAASTMNVVVEVNKTAYRDSVLSQNQLPTADVNSDDAAGCRTAPEVREVSKQKRLGHKQRQNNPPEKNFARDSFSASRTDGVKDHKDIGGAEVIAVEVASGAGKELAESPLVSDLPVQRKKNNRSARNKHKVEESSTVVSSSVAVPKDSTLAPPESAEQTAVNLNINSTSIQLSADAKDAVQPSETHSSLSREDAHGRVNHSWKAQHSRKPRSSQGNRSVEKSHSNDAVVWAPVRSLDKGEVIDQTTQKGAEPSAPATGDYVVNNGSKTKRAEMERYVPKPVAKEIAQQGSIQQSPSPSLDQVTTESVVKAGSAVESKHVDGKHRQKGHGSWRQRVSSESLPSQASQDSCSSVADSSKNTQSNGAKQTVKSDESLAKGSQANVTDGWNVVGDHVSSVKDNVPSGRGRRYPYKGHKGSGNSQNFDNKDSSAAGLTDLQFPLVETSQTERTAPPKENRGVNDRSSSHWQPKSQGYVAHNQQGTRSHGGHKFVPEESKALQRDSGHNGNKDVGEKIPSFGDQDNKRDKKAAHSPNQGHVNDVETDSSGLTDGVNEQRPSSGYRKNANRGSRFNRGHESRENWSSTGQENKQQYPSANQGRQRQNSHYEYQPVGPYNNSSSRSNDSGSQTQNQTGAQSQKFRDRGQIHPRRGRGNFYGRQSGNPTDAGYE